MVEATVPMTRDEVRSMRRSICCLGLGALGIASFGCSVAQPVDRSVRIGVLRPGVPADPGDIQSTALPGALRELGYVEGRNLLIEQRHAGGRLEKLPALAGEMIDAKVDAIVSIGVPATRAAVATTVQTPIVMFGTK